MSTSLPPPNPSREGDHPLARAFRSLAEAAGAFGVDEPAVPAAGFSGGLPVSNEYPSKTVFENQRFSGKFPPGL